MEVTIKCLTMRAHRANRRPVAMKDSIRQRIERMADRFEEVGRLLARPRSPGVRSNFASCPWNMRACSRSPKAMGATGIWSAN